MVRMGEVRRRIKLWLPGRLVYRRACLRGPILRARRALPSLVLRRRETAVTLTKEQ